MDVREQENSGLLPAGSFALRNFTSSGLAFETLENQRLPAIVAKATDFYHEGVVIESFPTIFDGELPRELRAEFCQLFERMLVKPGIFDRVSAKLAQMHGNNKNEPIIPRHAYDFIESVALARESDCPQLVTLIESCRNAGIL